MSTTLGTHSYWFTWSIYFKFDIIYSNDDDDDDDDDDEDDDDDDDEIAHHAQ